MDNADLSGTSLAHATLDPRKTVTNASKGESFILNIEDDVNDVVASFLVLLIYMRPRKGDLLCRSMESSAQRDSKNSFRCLGLDNIGIN